MMLLGTRIFTFSPDQQKKKKKKKDQNIEQIYCTVKRVK